MYLHHSLTRMDSFAFTFVTMVGGNPEHDAYGFRYWKDPGPFAEYLATGSLGKFEGFLGALWAASFCIGNFCTIPNGS